MAKTRNSYQKTDLAVLWFLNTIGCWRQIVLACFLCKKAFHDRMDCEYCCDNCIDNSIEIGHVPDFEVYDITAKLDMMYVCTMEYSDLLFSNERKRLLTTNPRSLQTIVDQTRAYEEALNNFAL